MIQKLTIDYSTELPRYKYIRGKVNNLLPAEINFDKKLNIIIGKNGSGKSTLLNILSDLTLCSLFGQPKLATDISLWDQIPIFFNDSGLVSNDYTRNTSYSIINDYDALVTKVTELGKGNNWLLNMYNFVNYYESKHESTGQSIIRDINRVSDLHNDHFEFTKEDIFPNLHCNDVYTKVYNNMRDLINEISVPTNPKINTILLDEPDRGLDIFSLKKIHKYLIEASKVSQVIVILHNPLLIKSLAPISNIIELTEGYLDKINKFK